MEKRKTPDLTGKKFGKWTAIKELPKRDSSGHVEYLCRCECGRERVVRASELTRGKSKGCAACCTTRLRKRDPEEVRAYANEHSTLEVMEHFNMTGDALQRYASRYRIKLPSPPPRNKRRGKDIVINAAKSSFNSAITPRIIPGVNERSPHCDRRWRWGGKDYLSMMHDYEKLVANGRT